MRAIGGLARYFRSAFRLQKHNYVSGFAKRPNHLIENKFNSTYKHIYNAGVNRYPCHSFMVSRTLCLDAAREDVSGGGPLVEYERRIAAGELFDGDSCQVVTIREIQRLYDELVQSANACKLDRYAASEKASRSRWLWSRFIPQSSYAPVQGLYLYGGVGTGKTMLMDLFYDQLPDNWRKKRIHFHDFMLNVHSRLQKHKGVSDPLEVVAGEISDEAILLCLDEFMERCVVHEIGSAVDYRKMTSAEQGFYFVGKDLSDFLKQKFQQLIGNHTAGPQEVEVIMGRKLQVPLGGNGCAYFPFEELCEKPLGAADYFGLFKNFHTLALEGVPIFGLDNRTSAYRFVTLIDVIYENKARLLCTAEGSSYELFERVVTISDAKQMAPRTSSRSRKNDDLDLCVDNELGFAKDRTISRLTELNSKEYLEHHAAMLAEKQHSWEGGSKD